MIRKIMISRFGGLKEYTLTLKEGINVIRADNEAGKSTVCGFIKAMLYGFSGSKRDIAGNDKKRFMTWGETSVSGSMEVELQSGQTLILHRILADKPSMNRITVKDKDTSERLALYEECPGEAIYGVTDEEFERTAFLGQNLHKIERSDILTAKLSNMALSADEDVPAGRAADRLHEVRRQFERQMKETKALLKEADERIARAEEQRKTIEGLWMRKEELLLALRKAGRERDDLLGAKASLECRSLDELKSQLVSCCKAAGEKEKLLKNGDFIADYEYVSLLKAKLAALSEMDTRTGAKREQCEVYAKDLTALSEELSRVWFTRNPGGYAEYGRLSGMEKEGREKLGAALPIREEIAKIDSECERFGEKSPAQLQREGKKTAMILPGVLCLLLGAGLFWLLYFYLLIKAAGIAALVLGAAGFAAFLLAARAKPAHSLEDIACYEDMQERKTLLLDRLEVVLGGISEKELSSRMQNCKGAMLSMFRAAGCEKEKDFLDKYDEYRKGLARIEFIEAEWKKAKDSYHELLNIRQARLADLFGAARRLRPGLGEEEEARRMIAETEQALTALSALRQNQAGITRLISALLDGREEETLYNLSKRAKGIYEEETKEGLQEKMKEAESRYIDLMKESERIGAMLEESAKNSISPDEAFEAYVDLSQRLTRDSIHAESVRMAIEGIQKGLEEMQRNFAPKLNMKAGEYLQAITAGRYGGVYISKDYRVEVADSLGEARDIEYFSAGTKDQIYLSLRLALLDMLEGENQKIPLILDDAFCQFDDTRLRNALVSLAQAGSGRQVILFTCHTRETDYMDEIAGGFDRTMAGK